MYASINGHDGSLWACSPGFSVQVEECKAVVHALTQDMSKVQSQGFTIAGQKYTFTRGEKGDDEDDSAPYVQGRCKEEGKSSQGVIVFVTGQAVVVGVHDPSYSQASFGKVNTDIGRIADYMIENGF